MQQIKIEKNKPLPDTGIRYPFADMQVGDSFVMPDKSARAPAHNFCKRLEERTGEKRKFRTMRITDPKDENYGKYRCGRVR